MLAVSTMYTKRAVTDLFGSVRQGLLGARCCDMSSDHESKPPLYYDLGRA